MQYTNFLLDIDEYLPATTRLWCKQQLIRLGFEGGKVSAEDAFPDGSRPHCEAYIQLRTAATNHVLSGNEPELAETAPPRGARNYKPSADIERAFREYGQPLVDEVILQDDGPDPVAVPEDFEEDICDMPVIE